MTRQNQASAVFLSILIVAAWGRTAHANDGCAVLGELVRAKVFASATEYGIDRQSDESNMSGRVGTVGSVGSGPQLCSHTAEAASKAFSESLSTLNMAVSWIEEGPMPPVYHCLSRNLNECYPFRNPYDTVLPPSHYAFLHDAWKGVRKAVASQMPFGTASDLSQFTATSLDAALTSSLQSHVEGPLYSSYPALGVGEATRFH